jgi:FkbM family methyltransferase
MKKIIKKTIKKLLPYFYDKLSVMKQSKISNSFKKAYPETILFPLSKREAYSQSNQDYIIYNHFFKDKTDGIFCDIGGNHPLNMNNTRHFEELGWSGYVFEPLPHMRPLWKECRSAKFFPFAASNEEGEVVFSVVKNATGWEDMLSFVKKTGEDVSEYEVEDITVKTRILKNVFSEEDIKHIDYMSIDVEGHELNVIKGIDFNKVRINVLTIENNPSCCVWYGDENIRQLMFKNDYILWGRIFGLDDIYVHKSFKKNYSTKIYNGI